LKHLISAILLLAVFSLVACAKPSDSSVSTVGGNTTTISSANSTTTAAPAQTMIRNTSDETEIRDLVTNFGKRLQNVSLLAQDAAQEIQNQYSEFVSPTLLEVWTKDVSQAPGRMVSSPWPDHIEVTTLSKKASDRYEITGSVIEVTSTEVVNGGVAARIPVRMTVQKDQGSWYIAAYTEER